MTKSLPLFVIFLFIYATTFGQKNNYHGVVVNKDKTPVDVISIVIFNTKDSTRQVYANTFNQGDFSVDFTPQTGEKYGAYLLSLGYKDIYMPLDKLSDTIVMPNTALRIGDVEIQGTRKVTSMLSTEGGILFDVSNTYLSNLGESTQLLNFIPGLNADNKDGRVGIMGVSDNVAIYINNIKLKDPEKLKSIKSEDIKSVEILRNPGAKYKGEPAVILIKTNRAIDGFSTRVGMSYYITDDHKYSISPYAEAVYTKNKITVSAAYSYNKAGSSNDSYQTRKINKIISTDNWIFNDNSHIDSENSSHWYNANIDYRINDKNNITFQYSGRYSDHNSNSENQQRVSSDSFGELQNNKYIKDNKNKTVGNVAHLYYRGDYSNSFSLDFNIDYVSRIDNQDNSNNWLVGTTPTIFRQKTNTDASAFTTDFLFTNTLKEKHTLSYGLEYSHLKDDVISNDMEETTTRYTQNSNFIKTVLQYRLQISEPLSLSAGFNYLYSNIEDNNTSDKGKNYNSIIPYLSLQYYNIKKEYGLSLSFNYFSNQPMAGMLDDITKVYVSDYEIITGNRNLKNMQRASVSLDFNYKNFQAGISYEHARNFIETAPEIKIQPDGKPLIISTYNNMKPSNSVDINVGYGNKFGFWTPSASAYLSYMHSEIAQPQEVNSTLNGFGGMFSLKNHFTLPKNFGIYLNGNYNTKSYRISEITGSSYSVTLNIEKSFMKNNLRISLEGKGIFSNKWTTLSSDINGLFSEAGLTNSWRRYIGINASWRFNNHRSVQKARENEYINML